MPLPRQRPAILSAAKPIFFSLVVLFFPKRVTQNNLQRGADVQWIYMFPGESEILFPPLNFLQKACTPLHHVIMNDVAVTVVEVSDTIA